MIANDFRRKFQAMLIDISADADEIMAQNKEFHDIASAQIGKNWMLLSRIKELETLIKELELQIIELKSQ